MSLTQLRYFVAVAEAGSVSRAAARCHVSQPPMSRQLRALEQELQVRLFERLPRGMRLSPVGEQVLHAARSILAQVDALSSGAATRPQVSGQLGVPVHASPAPVRPVGPRPSGIAAP